jgi:hypothetical protein
MSTYTPLVPTAQKLVYSLPVNISIDNNEINLADSTSHGHRVLIEVPKGTLNEALTWTRDSGSLYPTAAINGTTFANAIKSALNLNCIDLDGQADGLNFTYSALNTASDPRLRKDGVKSVNDWVVAYVLYKLYGTSSYDTKDAIFNVEDMHSMLATLAVSDAILDKVSADDDSQVATAIQKLFRDLLVADPKRFFDDSGVQITGLFETNVDMDASGNWNIVADDVIEIKLTLTFGAAITRRDVADSQFDTNTNPTTEVAKSTKEIAEGEKFSIRLQVKAV